MTVLAVAVGGACGALGRWGVNVWVQRAQGYESGVVGSAMVFPWWTLCVNALGCFLAGVLYVMFETKIEDPTLKLGVMVGFLGALTTFSTYGLESYLLLEQKKYALGIGNLVLSVVVGMVCVVIGVMIGRKLFGVV